METEKPLVSLAPRPSQIVAKEDGNVAVTALLPADMQKCQTELIAWCDRKIAEIQSDATELREACNQAREKKWKTSTLDRHAKIAEKRVIFYQKMKSALMAGYVIIPNFPVTLFAIRTTKEKPLHLMSTQSWGAAAHTQSADVLPAEQGDYKNPQPEVLGRKVNESSDPSKPNIKTQSWASDWQELDFPINMAKPEIMEATTTAMTMKVFDQFGILPSPYRKIDPIIVAQIIDPRATGYGPAKVVTFMIAWHLDSRSL